MRIFFLGICGTAMGNVALLLKSMGHEIVGADQSIYPPMSNVLQRSNIKIYEGYDLQQILDFKPDKIVVGNVITRGNPIIEWLLQSRSIPYCSLPELLATQILKDRYNIVVTGTHGKTTTTAIAAFLLKMLEADPGYLIGGVPRDLPSGACLGDLNSPFVIEGDEYDCAFFDKRSKFMHFLPSILVINNLEFDHGDIFRDLEDIQRSFSHLLRIVPQNGYVLINGDDENIQSLFPINWTTVLKIGLGKESDLRIVDFEENESGSEFKLIWKNQEWAKIQWHLNGIYNARNAAMASLSIGLTLYPNDPTQLKLDSLAMFQGVKRRQEILSQNEKIVVIEDFAHHPTALDQTLASLRNRYKGYKINACFEPRSNTACRKFHQETFRDALKNADRSFIGPVYRSKNYSHADRLDTERIANELQQSGFLAKAYSTNEALLNDLESIIFNCDAEKNLVCFFSNGSFDGIIEKFLKPNLV